MSFGQWFGHYFGQWFGQAQTLPPGFIAGTAAIQTSASASLAAPAWASGMGGVQLSASGKLASPAPAQPSAAGMAARLIRHRPRILREDDLILIG